MSNKIYSEKELATIRAREENWLNSQPGITGTSISLGQSGNPCLRIFAHRLSTPVKLEIKQRLANVPVEWSEGEAISY